MKILPYILTVHLLCGLYSKSNHIIGSKSCLFNPHILSNEILVLLKYLLRKTLHRNNQKLLFKQNYLYRNIESAILKTKRSPRSLSFFHTLGNKKRNCHLDEVSSEGITEKFRQSAIPNRSVFHIRLRAHQYQLSCGELLQNRHKTIRRNESGVRTR